MKNFVLKKIPIILVLSIVFTSVFSLFSLTASAHSYTGATSNSSSTVIVRPVSGSMSVGSIGVESVKVFWQENGYYYIEYTVSGYGGFKRGYVPTSKINVSGIGNNPYPAWNSSTSQNNTVYNRTTTVSYTIGTVYSTDSITVYAEEGDWYYIQYPVSGGYKRGYVPKSIVYKTPQTSGITNGAIYYIRNVNSGKYLDVQGAGTSSGTNVWQYDFNGSVAQQWQVEYLSNEGLYKLHPQNATTMNLDVIGSSMNNGDDIVIYGGDYSSSRWNIVNLGDGTFKLMSNCSERTKAMVVENASQSSGANVFQWDFNNGNNDKWVFVTEGPKTDHVNSASENVEFDYIYNGFPFYDYVNDVFTIISRTDAKKPSGNTIYYDSGSISTPDHTEQFLIAVRDATVNSLIANNTNLTPITDVRSNSFNDLVYWNNNNGLFINQTNMSYTMNTTIRFLGPYNWTMVDKIYSVTYYN